MQVILLEKIRNLGNLGDTVKVKSGFGRNFLIPQGKAVFASKENAEVFEKRRSELEKIAADKLAQANQRAEQLRRLTLKIDALASDEGKLYGSVGVNELAKAITDAGVEIARKEIVMPLGVIHEIGEHEFDAILHSDVSVTLSIMVGSPSDVEAAKKAKEAALAPAPTLEDTDEEDDQ